MLLGERYLRSFTESIEIKYLRAVRKGWTDTAIIVDTRDQEGQKSRAAEGCGSEIDPSLVIGSVIAGDRMALVGKLKELFPPNPATETLENEVAPEGLFPIVVITDEEGAAKMYFFYFQKPESE